MLNTFHKNLIFLNLLLCCSFVFIDAGCDKTTPNKKQQKVEFEIDKDYSRGPLTVHVRANKAKITIADTLILELQARIEPDYEVKMPAADKIIEHFGILDWDNLGDKLAENNATISTCRYRLEPFLSGTVSIPAFTFEFHKTNNAEDKKYELTTEPFDIEVTSLLGEQRAELKIAQIEGVIDVPAKPSYGWIAIPAGLIILAAIVFWLVRRRRQIVEMVRIFKPAHEIAYERLRILVERDLIKDGRIKEFYEEISDILRHYIEHRFNLKAPERTTEEFLVEMSSGQVLSPQDQDRLSEFLQHCDLVKFARYRPTTEQIQKMFDLVKNFIETTRSDDKKIDVTAMECDPTVESVSV